MGRCQSPSRKIVMKKITHGLCIFQVVASFIEKRLHDNAKLCTHSRSFCSVLGLPTDGVHPM